MASIKKICRVFIFGQSERNEDLFSFPSVPRKYLSILLLFVAGVFLAPAKILAAQASLFISPSAKSYVVGQTFTVSLNLSADLAVNAVEGNLVYPTDKLEALSVSKSGSIISLWVNEPVISKNSGNVYFAGVILNPGYKGRGVKILSVNFRVKAAGEAFVTVANGSALANDGYGTQILSIISGGRYKLEPKIVAPAPPPAPIAPVELPAPASLQIFSPTHPDQDKWYADNSPRLGWVLPSGTEGTSLILDNSPLTVPDTKPDGVAVFYQAENLKSGVWYFHTRVLKNNKWSQTARFRLKIDTDPPEEFKIEFFDEAETVNTQPQIFFGTNDLLSGIDRYILKIDDGDEFVLPATVGEKPFLLPKQPFGQVNLSVTAYDTAGNSFRASRSIKIISQTVKVAGDLFESVFFLAIVIVLTLISIILLAVIIIFYFKHRKRKRH